MPTSVPQFIESPRFELPPAWTYRIEPLYESEIVDRGRYGEDINLFTRYPRVRIDVNVPRDRAADIPLIRRWWHVTRGKVVYFRVRDPSDWLSTRDGLHVDDETLQPTPLDQPLIVIPGTEPTYQLYKQYAIGIEGTDEWIQERPIFKPVEGTIRVANDAGVEQIPDRWAIDYTTGILTPEITFEGVPTSWGGEFDTPVRFDSNVPLLLEEHLLRGTNFVLLERRYVAPV